MLPNRPQQKKTRNSSVKTSNFVIPPGSEFFDPETIREKEEKAIVGGVASENPRGGRYIPGKTKMTSWKIPIVQSGNIHRLYRWWIFQRSSC